MKITGSKLALETDAGSPEGIANLGIAVRLCLGANAS